MDDAKGGGRPSVFRQRVNSAQLFQTHEPNCIAVCRAVHACAIQHTWSRRGHGVDRRSQQRARKCAGGACAQLCAAAAARRQLVYHQEPPARSARSGSLPPRIFFFIAAAAGGTVLAHSVDFELPVCCGTWHAALLTRTSPDADPEERVLCGVALWHEELVGEASDMAQLIRRMEDMGAGPIYNVASDQVHDEGIRLLGRSVALFVCGVS